MTEDGCWLNLHATDTRLAPCPLSLRHFVSRQDTSGSSLHYAPSTFAEPLGIVWLYVYPYFILGTICLQLRCICRAVRALWRMGTVWRFVLSYTYSLLGFSGVKNAIRVARDTTYEKYQKPEEYRGGSLCE